MTSGECTALRNVQATTMPRKKKPSVSSREALRRVRKDLPPPVRRQEDDKKYRRPAARRAARQEVETSTEEA